MGNVGTNQGLAGVRIEVELLFAEGRGLHGNAKTDAQGYFHIDGLVPGRYLMQRKSFPGYLDPTEQSRELKIESEERDTILNLRLSKGIPVSGIVQDAVTGEPVAGARVSSSGRSRTVTSETGTFSLDRVHHDFVGYWVQHDAYEEKPEVSHLNSGMTVLRVLPRPRLRGTIVNANTGMPVAEFSPLVMYSPDADPYESDRDILHSADGTFEIYCYPMRSTHVLHVFAPGYADSIYPIDELTPGAVLDHLRIELHPAVELTGRVTSTDGAPVGGALILRTPLSKFDSFHKEHALATTDQKGDFTVTEIGADDTELVVLASHYPPQVFPIDSMGTGTLSFVLEAGEEMTGLVTLDGRPTAQALVSAEIYTDMKTSHRVGPFLTDTNGMFHVASVPIGRVTLTVEVSGSPGLKTVRHDLYIRPGGSDVMDVHLLSATGTVEGQLLMSDSRPLPGLVYLQPSTGNGMSQHTGGDGKFRFENVHAGPVSLAAQVDSLDSQQQSVEFDLLPNRVNARDVVLDGRTNINVYQSGAPNGSFVSATLLTRDRHEGWDLTDPKVLDKLNPHSTNWTPIEWDEATLHATPKGDYILVIMARSRHDRSDSKVRLFDIQVTDQPEIDIEVNFEE